MAATASKTIILKTRTDCSPMIRELLATEAITPGHLVERASATTVRKHATDGGNAQKLFAVEQTLINNLAAADIDTACASGDQIPFVSALPGDVIYALVAAGASAIAVGDPLQSHGDGTVAKHTPPSDAAGTTIKHMQIVGFAAEAVDNSLGGSVARIRLEVA